jgi:hypothetical protein
VSVLHPDRCGLLRAVGPAPWLRCACRHVRGRE